MGRADPVSGGTEGKRSNPFGGPLDLRELEKRAIAAALERNGGHRERSAAELGITRRTLLNKMNEYDLR